MPSQPRSDCSTAREFIVSCWIWKTDPTDPKQNDHVVRTLLFSIFNHYLGFLLILKIEMQLFFTPKACIGIAPNQPQPFISFCQYISLCLCYIIVFGLPIKFCQFRFVIHICFFFHVCCFIFLYVIF